LHLSSSFFETRLTSESIFPADGFGLPVVNSLSPMPSSEESCTTAAVLSRLLPALHLTVFFLFRVFLCRVRSTTVARSFGFFPSCSPPCQSWRPCEWNLALTFFPQFSARNKVLQDLFLLGAIFRSNLFYIRPFSFLVPPSIPLIPPREFVLGIQVFLTETPLVFFRVAFPLGLHNKLCFFRLGF